MMSGHDTSITELFLIMRFTGIHIEQQKIIYSIYLSYTKSLKPTHIIFLIYYSLNSLNSLNCASCALSPSCLHCACAVGAEWEAYHRSCREEPLWCLCVCGQQHCGSEREQGGPALCSGWDNIPMTAHRCFNNIGFEFSPMCWMQLQTFFFYPDKTKIPLY